MGVLLCLSCLFGCKIPSLGARGEGLGFQGQEVDLCD